MTTFIQDILDVDALTKHIAHGEITERFHPEFPELVIYNYSDKVAFSGVWTHETRTCRGLIVNLDTQEVLARPFAKFFNYGQEKVDYDLDAVVYHVGDKEDGSLGIMYRTPDGKYSIATRGSFVSDQAIHATEKLQRDIKADFEIQTDFTHLWEIVYPENRIVLDYGDRDELIYLGCVHVKSGAFGPPLSDWFGQRDQPTTLREVMLRDDRPNKEGYVVWLDEWTAIKLKQQDYVELHRIVTGLNRKSIWRIVSASSPLEWLDFYASLPDELTEWAQTVGREILDEYAAILAQVDMHYLRLLDYIEDEEVTERKDMAEWVFANVPKEYIGMVFTTLDGRDIQDKVWKLVEPVGGGK